MVLPLREITNIVRALLLLPRLAIGAFFIYAGAAKAFHPNEFADTIEHFRLIPVAAVLPLARFIALMECVAGAALMLGLLTRGAAFVIGILSIIFALAIESALLRHLDIDCGCMGAHSSPISSMHLLLNIIVSGFCAILTCNQNPFFALDSKLSGLHARYLD